MLHEILKSNQIDKIETLPINLIVSYYLMSCFLYYELDLNVLSDYEFNILCKRLINEYNTITHMHKKLIDVDELKASTGYTLTYTRLIKHASIIWYEQALDNKIPSDILIRVGY